MIQVNKIIILLDSTLFYAGITLASGLITDFLINRLNKKQIEEDHKPLRSITLRKRSFSINRY